MQRLMKRDGLTLHESPHVGAEFVDDAGRSYDAVGRPQPHSIERTTVLASIDSHLLKANDFTVIDLTGFTPDQIG